MIVRTVLGPVRVADPPGTDVPLDECERIEREVAVDAYAYCVARLAHGECLALPVPRADEMRRECAERGIVWTRAEVYERCARYRLALADAGPAT